MSTATYQTKLLIGGQWVDSVSGETIPVTNPYTGQTICNIAAAQAADVDLAVEAAARAAPGWAALPAHERGRLLLKLADKIEAATDSASLDDDEYTLLTGLFNKFPFAVANKELLAIGAALEEATDG